MPDPLPLNALQPGGQPRLTVPPIDERPAIRIRIVARDGPIWVDGVAHGWTSQVVYVAWTDSQGYGRLDYFPAADVKRG
jgi:hypothetical protein